MENTQTQPKGASKFPIVCQCPKCGGNILSGAKGFFCSNYKSGCKVGGYKKVLSASFSDQDFAQLLSGAVIEKTLKKDDREWSQKLLYNFDEYKLEFVKAPRKEFGMLCPKCGAKMMESEKGVFCEDREKCQFVIWKNFLGHTFTKEEIETLLAGKTTEKITLRGKSGKQFYSCLSYDFVSDRVTFDF